MLQPPSPRRIGFVGFPRLTAVDLVGTLEAFSIASGSGWDKPPLRYEMVVLGLSMEPFRSESGLIMAPSATLDEAGVLDTIVLPGGPGLREPGISEPIGRWLRERLPTTRRIVSICTGLYGLAAAGLMDGRRATTHWHYAADFSRRYPQVALDPDAIFIKDGQFYSSGGMTAGIDLALALIEEDFGPALALATARGLVVYMKRSGGQLQYSQPLRFQAEAGELFADLAAAITADLSANWDLSTMAARTNLGPRQFARRFKERFGISAGTYVDHVRLDQARQSLVSSSQSMARVAESVGFRSEDGFRRAFERRFGVTPSTFRSRFSPTTHSSSHEPAS